MASKLEGAMIGLIAVFNQYSEKDSNKTKLNHAVFKTLCQNELGICPTGSNNPNVVNLMQSLDRDKDGQMEFPEYVFLIAGLIMACDLAKTTCDKSADESWSTLEKAIRDISEVFYQYSEKEGDKNKLNKSELKALLQSEYAELITNSADQQQVDTFLSNLDRDGDGEVDFNEYIGLVTALSMFFNVFFRE